MIFLVIRSDYFSSDCQVLGAFSTEELARQFLANIIKVNNIKEEYVDQYQIDAVPIDDFGMYK